VPDILNTAEALLRRADGIASLPQAQRTAEKLVMFGELRDVMTAVIAFHRGYAEVNRSISSKATALASLFYEARPDVWLLRPELSRHYRSELQALCEAVKRAYE